MHSHGAQAHDTAPEAGSAAALARRRLRRLLAAVLVPLMVLTAVALVVLLPRGAEVDRFPAGLGPQTDLVRAELLTREVVPCPERTPADGQDELVPVVPPSDDIPGVGQTECIAATVRLLSGPDEGDSFVLDSLSTPVTPFPETGRVLLSYEPTAAPGEQYAFADVERRRPLLLLAALFAVAVVALGRWTGLRALFGLGLSLLVLTTFVLPALLAGSNALLVALVGSAAVMFVVLYLAHGVRVQTSIAVLGTLASLLLTVVLAEVFVRASALTGLGSDETSLISATVGTVDLRGLLLAGIVIGSLGVLDDVTVTQSSAVWELHLANPAASARDLYRSGIRIGRDHIASTVNTLVLAYVGASLPLLVVYSLAGSSVQDVLTSEVVAQEVVRTLVGSIGLVAAVPLTTALAALTVRVDRVR
ncbi:MAG: YibE/F family protein [Mycobacteriales bacterium]